MVVALAPVFAGLSSCSSDDGAAPAKEPAPAPEIAHNSANPLSGHRLYVDPQSPPALQAARWRSDGRKQDAAAMQLLASRPTAVWFADEGDIASRVRAAAQSAAQRGRTALLVAYHVPGRDCGSYSAGGSGSAAAYRAWVRAFARGIGTRRAIVILEPDAIPQAVEETCLSAERKAERYALLRYGVKTLGARSNVAVYLDAGNPGWIRPAARLVGPLRASGVRAADGFALNVSNFFRTGTAISYGRSLSRRLGGAHFVIDTSRNGKGAWTPPPGKYSGDPETWCNPPGRGMGPRPTSGTGVPLVDAYLYVKTIGESDGSCTRNTGSTIDPEYGIVDPAAGAWWPEQAHELARNAEPRLTLNHWSGL